MARLEGIWNLVGDEAVEFFRSRSWMSQNEILLVNYWESLRVALKKKNSDSQSIFSRSQMLLNSYQSQLMMNSGSVRESHSSPKKQTNRIISLYDGHFIL